MTRVVTTQVIDPPQTDRERPGPGGWLLRALALLLAIAAVLTIAALVWSWRSIPLAIGIGIAGVTIADGLIRRWRGWFSRVMGIGMMLLASMPLTVGLVQLWSWYGPRPDPVRRTLYQGVEYVREVVDAPEPAVVHIIIADLEAEGVEVVVTPPDFPDAELPLKARTTSQFVREFDLQAAVNANLYSPFRKRPVLHLYPLPGEPVKPAGGAASGGVQFGQPNPYWVTLDFPAHGPPRIGMDLPQPWYNAVTGVKHFIQKGEPIWVGPIEESRGSSFAAIDRTGTRLFLVTAEGIQPPYAAGIRRSVLAEILIKHGAYEAVQLDGGGSTTMAIEGRDGLPITVNRPVQIDMPMIERPVGTHLGIRARRLD